MAGMEATPGRREGLVALAGVGAAGGSGGGGRGGSRGGGGNGSGGGDVGYGGGYAGGTGGGARTLGGGARTLGGGGSCNGPEYVLHKNPGKLNRKHIPSPSACAGRAVNGGAVGDRVGGVEATVILVQRPAVQPYLDVPAHDCNMANT
eukprot:44949-Chlamydomonas_euryale.AAC.4